MKMIMVHLNEQDAQRLQVQAVQHGATIEQMAEELLHATLAGETSNEMTGVSFPPDDPQGIKWFMSLGGNIPSWPGREGEITNTTNEEIDRLIGEEAGNPHENE